MIAYFDNSATTKTCEEALARYIEVSREHYGNPSSLHAMGSDAESIMRESADIIKKTVGGGDCEVIFTASGTEANNLAIFGRIFAKDRYKKGRIITSRGEHSSVSSPIAHLSELGYDVADIPTPSGVLDIEALRAALTRKTVLITLMLVNNETGALYDIAPVVREMRMRCPDCVLHIDATQAFMKVPINMKGMGIDMMSISSHKIEGPKGTGALLVNRALLTKKGLVPVTLGGGQQLGLRSGTENLPSIAAFATAARIAHENFSERTARVSELREYILSRLAEVECTPLMPKAAAPHIINIILPSIKSQTMLNFLSAAGIYVSSGSACSSHTHRASNALASYGVDDKSSDYSIRISLSHRNTREEADCLIEKLKEGISTLQRVK